MTRGVRKGLTPAKVLEAAFKVVDGEGADALTMRRLGIELGAAAMAVYNHFPDRDALLDALTEETLGSLPIPVTAGSWEERLRAIVRAVSGLAVQHPRIYQLVMSRPIKPRASIHLMTEAMAALRQSGLDDVQAVRWYHTFLILIHGFPSWRISHEQFCAQPPQLAEVSQLASAQLQVWNLVHDVNPQHQLDCSIELLIEALKRHNRD